MTTLADIGLAQDVIPKGCLATRTRGSDAHLVRGEWSYSQVACHGLARGQSHTLPSLQVTNGERMIGLNLGFTGDRYRQFDQGLYKFSVHLLGSLRPLGTRRVKEQFPVDRMLARYSTESQKVRKKWDRITLWVQAVAVTNLRMAVSVGGISKFERNKGVMTGTIITRALPENLIGKGRPDERRQKLVENDPLIVPPQLPGGFVEHATIGYSRPPGVIDKRIVSLQHRQVQLRDQHVRVIAWIANDRGALCVSLNICIIQTKQKLRRVVTLIEEGVASWSIPVQRFEVEFRAARIV